MADDGETPTPPPAKKPKPNDSSDSEPSQPPPNIWDTISNLNGYPLLRVATELASENFDLCLSKSYAAVDKKETTNHLQVIRGLKGSFLIDDKNREPDSYATCGPSKEGVVGIYFNKAIAEKSNRVVRNPRFNTDKLLKNINVIGIIATMQQVVEHEIGHMKYHQEGINDHEFKQNTPTKKEDPETVLDGEAGYAPQRQVISDNPRPLARFVNGVLGINEDLGEGVQFEVDEYQYQLCKLEVDKESGKLKAAKGMDARALTIDQIIKLMDYPKKRDDCDGPDLTPNDPDDGAGRGGDGGGHGRGSGGGGRRGGGRRGGGQRGGRQQRHGGNWLSSVRTLIDTTMRAMGGGHRECDWLDSVKSKLGAAMADADKVWNPPEFNFRSNPERQGSWDQKVEVMGDDGEVDKERSRFLACEINILPCNENWEEKYLFTPDEHICAKIEIKNGTQERVLVRVNLGQGFGEHGMRLEFADIKPGYCRGDKGHSGIPIEIGETYTLWRCFTSGKDPSMTCAYNTPEVPGKYVLRVKYGSEYHEHLKEIEVVAADDSN